MPESRKRRPDKRRPRINRTSHRTPLRAVYIGPEIAEDAPPVVREGLARRRLTAVNGRCPCGAVIVHPRVFPVQVTTVAVWHEHGCPAASKKVDQWLRRSGGDRG